MSLSHTSYFAHARCALLLAAIIEPSLCAGLGSKAAAAKWMAEKITWGAPHGVFHVTATRDT